ncbi:vacuolar segregation subunit 7-domain-containing protein [Tuber indicum]|nr:vacuolar segregation subunit 7-domain-containing protein [Tuber indicum]
MAPPPDFRSPALSPQKKGDHTNSNTSPGVPQSVYHLRDREGNPEDPEEFWFGISIIQFPKSQKGEKAGWLGAPRSQAESESVSDYKSEEKAAYSNSSNSRAPPPSQLFARRPPTTTGSNNFSKNMTVETETVSSVPQVTVGAAGVPGGAWIRSKKINDTIRAPKKDKKKPTKRAGGGGPANPWSKADLFARRVAEAVEANSSIPRKPLSTNRTPLRHHRNPPKDSIHEPPSATSIQGGPDRGLRLPLLGSMDGNQSAGRNGMKFANTSGASNTNAASDGATGEASGDREGGGWGGSGPSAAVGGAGGSRPEGQLGSGQKEKGGNSRGQNGHRALLPSLRFHCHINRRRTLY